MFFFLSNLLTFYFQKQKMRNLFVGWARARGRSRKWTEKNKIANASRGLKYF